MNEVVVLSSPSSLPLAEDQKAYLEAKLLRPTESMGPKLLTGKRSLVNGIPDIYGKFTQALEILGGDRQAFEVLGFGRSLKEAFKAELASHMTDVQDESPEGRRLATLDSAMSAVLPLIVFVTSPEQRLELLSEIQDSAGAAFPELRVRAEDVHGEVAAINGSWKPSFTAPKNHVFERATFSPFSPARRR